MIFDAFMYNGEADILEMRLNILDKVVDKFVIIESMFTFSGREKELPLSYWRERERFKKWEDKIEFYPIDHNVTEKKYGILADSSPNVPKGGPSHWRREFIIKESIKGCLENLEIKGVLRDNDTVFLSDVDEIWNPEITKKEFAWVPYRLKQLVYVYYLNNRSDEPWAGTLVAPWRYIKDCCLNELRTRKCLILKDGGWHFTSVGGPEKLKEKLTDSYTEESYATKEVLDRLEENIKNKRDFLGRDFTYKVDETEWPEYLKNNKNKYKHLCLN